MTGPQWKDVRNACQKGIADGHRSLEVLTGNDLIEMQGRVRAYRMILALDKTNDPIPETIGADVPYN